MNICYFMNKYSNSQVFKNIESYNLDFEKYNYKKWKDKNYTHSHEHDNDDDDGPIVCFNNSKDGNRYNYSYHHHLHHHDQKNESIYNETLAAAINDRAESSYKSMMLYSILVFLCVILSAILWLCEDDEASVSDNR